MRHPMPAFLAWLLLALSSHFTVAAEATLKDVTSALASSEPVIIIGVPAEFLHPDSIEGDAIETQSDWATYLNEWMEKSAKEKKIKVIVVPLAVLTKALQKPVFKGADCVTLYVRNRTEGLLYDSDCVPGVETYDRGAGWLLGAPASDEIKRLFKTTPVVARTRK
jgi:hypothetical protein